MPICSPFGVFSRCFNPTPSYPYSTLRNLDDDERMSEDWIFGIRPRDAPCTFCNAVECTCAPRVPNHRHLQPPRSILRNPMALPREGNPLASPAPARNPGISFPSSHNHDQQLPAWLGAQVPTLAIANATMPTFVGTPVTTPVFSFPPTPFPMSMYAPVLGANATMLTPATVPITLTPALSVQSLPGSMSVFGTPVGPMLTWVPHPRPHPTIPASSFWPTNILGGPRQWPSSPLDSPAVLRLTGGWPLPGTAPIGWSPVWPLASPLPEDRTPVPIRLCPWLAPNPADPRIPHMVWDIAQLPSIAKRMTGRHSVVDLSPNFDDDATYPALRTIHIVCDAGNVNPLWGPIVVGNDSKINLYDVLLAIYDYFQTPLTQAEVDIITDARPGNFELLRDTYFRRCRKASGIFQYELRQGFKRVDCLGDNRAFWGTWITYNPNNTWQLNLGLVPIKR